MNFRENPKTESREAELFREILFAVLFVAFILLISSPLFGQTKKKARKEPDLSRLVWPQPPQRPRVRYVGEITGVEQFQGQQKKRGWMDRVAGVKETNAQTQLRKPYGVAADSRGRVYVADAASRLVFVFDQTNKKVDYRGHRAPAQIALPVGVAVDDRDRLFVSDSYFHQVSCFDPEGELLGVFGSSQLARGAGVAVDSQRRRVYVADSKAHRVGVFDSDSFTFLRYVGAPSARGEAEEGKFSAPTNVAVDAAGFLFVTDTWNNRIQVFDPDGNFVRAFGGQGVAPGMFIRPKGIAFDSEGHLYVADAEFNNFQILTAEGQPLLAVGSFGVDRGQFILIAGIAIDKNNRIYVTQQWRSRVQIFEYLPEKPADTQAKRD